MRKVLKSLRAVATRLRREEDGATALEFAIISFPLMLMIFGVLEIAMMLLASSTLQLASEQAARDIRTGVFQQSATPTLQVFRNSVCSHMSWLGGSCDANLVVQAQVFADFDDMANAPEPQLNFDPTTPNANTTDATGGALPFATGAPCDIVLVRTYYRWKMMTPLMGKALTTAGGDGSIQMLSTATAFRNEPYDVNPNASTQC